MFQRTNGWMYIVIALIVLGLFSGLFRNPGGVILPLAIFGVIFYLFKFPPRWLMRWVGQPPGSAKRYSPKRNKAKVTRFNKNDKKQPPNRKRRKDVPFKVIDGNKKDRPPRRNSQ